MRLFHEIGTFFGYAALRACFIKGDTLRVSTDLSPEAIWDAYARGDDIPVRVQQSWIARLWVVVGSGSFVTDFLDDEEEAVLAIAFSNPPLGGRSILVEAILRVNDTPRWRRIHFSGWPDGSYGDALPLRP